jgi:hypothetical protein
VTCACAVPQPRGAGACCTITCPIAGHTGSVCCIIGVKTPFPPRARVGCFRRRKGKGGPLLACIRSWHTHNPCQQGRSAGAHWRVPVGGPCGGVGVGDCGAALRTQRQWVSLRQVVALLWRGVLRVLSTVASSAAEGHWGWFCTGPGALSM